MSGYDLVQDLAIVLVIAGIVGFIFQRIGLSNIVGFLVAGLLVGPHASRFGLVSDPGAIEGLSQLGLAFLMFSIGLDLSISKMRRFGLGVAARRSDTGCGRLAEPSAICGTRKQLTDP